jgi:hypothetical protein
MAAAILPESLLLGVTSLQPRQRKIRRRAYLGRMKRDAGLGLFAPRLFFFFVLMNPFKRDVPDFCLFRTSSHTRAFQFLSFSFASSRSEINRRKVVVVVYCA